MMDKLFLRGLHATQQLFVSTHGARMACRLASCGISVKFSSCGLSRKVVCSIFCEESTGVASFLTKCNNGLYGENFMLQTVRAACPTVSAGYILILMKIGRYMMNFQTRKDAASR